MENNFSEKDSLRIINEMIIQTRNNIQIGAASSMVFCGYFVAFAALAEVILINILDNPAQANWIWLSMIPMIIISSIIRRRKDRSAIVRTPIDRIIRHTWKGFMISVIVLLTILFSSGYIFNTWIVYVLITPFILLLIGLGQYVTGVTTKFKPFQIGAWIFWIGSLLCIILSFKVFNRAEIPFIILAICMITGFIIPGHTLNRLAKKENNV